jgi:hypothetical protein
MEAAKPNISIKILNVVAKAVGVAAVVVVVVLLVVVAVVSSY